MRLFPSDAVTSGPPAPSPGPEAAGRTSDFASRDPLPLRAAHALAGAIIAIVCALLLWRAQSLDFLNCDMECGETMLAIRSAKLFLEHGVQFGLLENLGDQVHPSIYTHNVNIGGLMLVALAALGLPESLWLVAPIVVFAAGLLYVYRTFVFFCGSSLCGLVALVVFSTTYWGLGAFALNPLRSWHLVAFFAIVFHISKLVSSGFSATTAAGLVFGALAAFGCGYDFWIIGAATSGATIVLAADVSLGRKVRLLAGIGVVFATPFLVRQVHVASVLGISYWAQDFIYSVAIKIPFASNVIQIPTLDTIDEYYRSRNILRPPAQPSNSAAQIFFTFQHMIDHVTVPRWGLLSIALFLLCIAAAPIPLWRSRLADVSYRLLLPMTLGLVIGVVVFAPFSLHVYFKHELPLLAFPLLAAKSIVCCVLVFTVLEYSGKALAFASILALATIVADAGLVHWNNTVHSEYPNFAWVPFYRTHRAQDFALSTYQLRHFDPPFVGATDEPGERFSIERFLKGEEPTQPFWIYQPADYLTDFDRAIPLCGWTGWLRSLRGQSFHRHPGKNCVYQQPTAPGALPPPPALDQVANAVRSYDVVERSDRGIGYLIMRKRPPPLG